MERVDDGNGQQQNHQRFTLNVWVGHMADMVRELVYKAYNHSKSMAEIICCMAVDHKT